MCVNLDVQSHPVGCSPPQILVFSFHSESNFTLAFSIVLEKGINKNTANIFDKENDTFLALDLKILWCKRSHRVRFYIHVHVNVYVFNLRKLPNVVMSVYVLTTKDTNAAVFRQTQGCIISDRSRGMWSHSHSSRAATVNKISIP